MIIHQSTFTLFGRQFGVYGFLMVFGFALALVISLPKVKKYGLKLSEVFFSGCFAIVGGVIGAKLLAIICYLPDIVKNPRLLLAFLTGGFVFYGGLIGGEAMLLLYCKVFRVNFAKYADIFAPGAALGHAFGRVGCLISGCCHGMETSGGFFIIYENPISATTPTGVPLVPVQLLEIICLVAIFVLSEILFYRTKRPGITALFYAFTYSIARFILEFFRGDGERGVLFGVSTSQYISFAIFLLCYFLILRLLLEHYGRLPKKSREIAKK